MARIQTEQAASPARGPTRAGDTPGDEEGEASDEDSLPTSPHQLTVLMGNPAVGRAGETLPRPASPYRRVRIQQDQGRGGVRIQAHCTSVPLLLILRFYC
jgi:hypothetical protein